MDNIVHRTFGRRACAHMPESATRSFAGVPSGYKRIRAGRQRALSSGISRGDYDANAFRWSRLRNRRALSPFHFPSIVARFSIIMSELRQTAETQWTWMCALCVGSMTMTDCASRQCSRYGRLLMKIDTNAVSRNRRGGKNIARIVVCEFDN